MRFEPNINLHIERDGRTYKTPICEVKNLNSFRALDRTVAFEIDRQLGEWRADPQGFTLKKLGKQNRGYDDAREQTVFQREKEEAHDYRYFPDPDLAPVRVDDAWRRRVAGTVGELPLARKTRYTKDYGLSGKEADALTQDAPSGDLLDSAVGAGAEPKRCANLLLGRGAAIANERGCTIAEVGVPAEALADLAKMLSSGEINASSADKVYTKLAESGGSPRAVAESAGLLAVTDAAQIGGWVDEAIAANAKAVADAKEGGKKQKKAFGFLMGQVMQKSRGAAQPAEVQRLLRERLGL
jgi:aspartyl-tRNA(Asn)/glutamyl-tRNA(Gln) amidotransferase subunit B